MTPVPDITSLLDNTNFIVCSLNFLYENSLIVFSENRAGKGGDDIYGAKLMDCKIKYITDKQLIPHVGQPNQTSWYFDTPLMKHFHFNNTDRISSMSSDPIMVCFCITTATYQTALIGHHATYKHIQD